MLPILNKKQGQVAGLIIKNRTPDEKPEEDQDNSSYGVEACAKDLIDAVHAKDIKRVAEALKSAFDVLESIPHEEIEPHSYDAQNIKAAQGEE